MPATEDALPGLRRHRLGADRAAKRLRESSGDVVGRDAAGRLQLNDAMSASGLLQQLAGGAPIGPSPEIRQTINWDLV